MCRCVPTRLILGAAFAASATLLLPFLAWYLDKRRKSKVQG